MACGYSVGRGLDPAACFLRPGGLRVVGMFPPLRLPSAGTHGLRLAHHAARLGAALAFCDRCPCEGRLYSATRQRLPSQGSWMRRRRRLRGYVPRSHAPAGKCHTFRDVPTAGSRPRPTDRRKRHFLFLTFRQVVGAACMRPVGVGGGEMGLRGSGLFTDVL